MRTAFGENNRSLQLSHLTISPLTDHTAHTQQLATPWYFARYRKEIYSKNSHILGILEGPSHQLRNEVSTNVERNKSISYY